MCDVGAIGLGLSAVGMLGSAYSVSQEQKAYANYQQLQSQSALNNYIQQSKQINLRYSQEQEANAQEREQIRIENMKAKATAQASAASSGIEGITIDNLFAGYNRATAVSNYTHARNLNMLGLEYNNQLDAYRVQALSTIYSMGSYQGASVGSTLLSGVGGMMSQYSKTNFTSSRNSFFKKSTKSTGTRISYSPEMGTLA